MVPSFVSAFRAQQLAYVAIYLVALIGLNILTGYTGQISLGHGAFMAVGGYTTAILMADHGVKDVWTIPIAALVTGVVGFLFGLPALRLSGLYLALATFAIAVSTPAVIKRFEDFTGGGSGINLFGVPELTASLTPVTILGKELLVQRLALLPHAGRSRSSAYVLAWLLLRGRTGLALRAVRDSETAAQSSGVSLPKYKTLAFGVSAAYAGVAGLAVRDRDDVRQPGHVPDRALDPAARRRRRRRPRLARRADRRRRVHPVPADLVAGDLQVAGRSVDRLRACS